MNIVLSWRVCLAGSAGYQCERCGKVFAYQYYRDKHLKYTRCVDQGDRKFPCHLCTRYDDVHNGTVLRFFTICNIARN